MSDFLQEFDEYLDSLTHLPGRLIIAGDFNIHVEDLNDPDTINFNHLISNYGLIQHISISTHIGGGILDLVLTRSNACDMLNIKDINVVKTVTTSDHYFVNFSIAFPHHKGSHKEDMVGRKISDIDMNLFKEDLLLSDINDPINFTDCNSATELYNKELRRILDKHAPLICFSINPDQSKWVDTKCQTARRKRRKAERDNRRLQTADSKLDYKKAVKHAEAVINTTRQLYYENRLKSCEDNKKDTYKIVNQLMDRDISKNLKPNIKPAETLCEEMKDFFNEKVNKIYSAINNDTVANILPEHSEPFQGEAWSQFETISDTDLKKILSDLNKKECEEDPIPLKLLMQCFDEVKPIVSFIINDSLVTGKFPSVLKNALVRPAIKDEKGDVNSFNNYRPISNLPFLSKLIEKSVQKQMTKHLDYHNLHAEHQSGYRSNHSCETATLTIYNDLLCISDMKSKVILLLLDLSAAFDTVNHHLLLIKLKKDFGFEGTVLEWFTSYLNNRSFTVTIDKSRSNRCFLRIGVPQGSILGPILFILYTKELNQIAKRHGFNIHMYADDTQLYIEFNPLFRDLSTIEERITNCFEDIKTWMTQNKLKLNQNKTEALVVQTKNSYSSCPVDSIQLDNAADPVDASRTVKSLGVLFDQFLTFEDQVNSIISCCNIHLRNLRVIGSKLNYDLKRQLIHCLIFSKLDYCNGLLYGLPDSLIKKLQKVQNSCVRFLFGWKAIKKWDSVTPFLKKAHFLPIRQRIEYKIALTVFKCVNNIAPEYITKCIDIKSQPVRVLRTEEDYFLLNVPPISNYSKTERSFCYCGPSVWNQLPYQLRTLTDIVLFKKRLKTHLFEKVFV